MLDLFNFASNPKADVQVFIGMEPSNNIWRTYNVPRGKSMLFIYSCAGGGGGAGGASGAAGTARGGGGGGPSNTVTTLMVPLSLVPSILFIAVGGGGIGGAADTAGGRGAATTVAVAPNFTATNTLLTTFGTAATNPALPGTSSAGGAGGFSTSASIISNMPLAGLGLWQTIAGQVGTNGGAHTGAAGGAQSLPTSGANVMGGTGGGGVTATDQAGGLITGVTSSLISEGRPINAPAGSNNGSGGFNLNNLFFSYPGLGGGSSNAGTGGAGGNGGYGCGGGGGGAGVTGGRGGDGGPGVVVMIAW